MRLEGKKILIFAANYFEDLELHFPRLALKGEGAQVTLAGLSDETVHGKHGVPAKPDTTVDQCRAEEFDAIVIPGGFGPDFLRTNEHVLRIVREAANAGIPVAAICHAPWVLVSAGLCKGRRMTSWHSIKDDVVNAGANWVDEPCVIDGNIITSRMPDDLPVFCDEITKMVAGEQASAAQSGQTKK
ncbi:MAG TPA: type 1 glutamine amidotransferase domain-containing protein [Blastocatellia bacterium]|nr:type 1 glutamine amidotransferase domain-containing protein [Blastocatellia bacterium]